MKKVILLIVLVLTLCGCSAKYEITLKNNKITEKFVIVESDKSIFDKQLDTGWTIRESFESLLNDDDYASENYEIKSLINDEQLGIEYVSKETESILSSSIVQQCYKNPSVIEEGNIVTINTGTEFQCYELYENLENIEVILKTDYKVISSNADSINNDTYIWNISEGGNKQIEIAYEVSDNSSKYVYYVIGALSLILIVVFIYTRNKIKNKNEF